MDIEAAMQSDVVWFDSIIEFLQCVSLVPGCYSAVNKKWRVSARELKKRKTTTKNKPNDDNEEDVMLLPNYIVRL